ncbi:MAG: nitrile hydratase subunit beta [Methylobacteriaceae bacterium]|nr:nitrile hydratase subunit beta [Methylobacteriaceae bacterium]
MNGAQDLGGMTSFGPVRPEQDEPVFHAEWEKRALAVTLACNGMGEWTGDRNRFERESLEPGWYLTHSYYEIWLAALQNNLARKGFVGADEIAAGRALRPAPPAKRKLVAEDVAAVLAKGSPYDRPAPAPARFAVGDRVRAKLMNPAHHTRLPRYARGRVGAIESVRGVFVFPDANAHDQGEQPHWCYTVRFAGRDLWGEDADPTLVVTIDAWEPYLEPAQ